MRHRKRGNKLNRSPSHRLAMVRNLIASLFRHERVFTTVAKAKAAKPLAERLISLAKDGTLAARRRTLAILPDKQLVRKLFAEAPQRYGERHGGYCRIIRTARRRIGDGTPLAIFELVDAKVPSAEKTAAAKEEATRAAT